MKMRSAAEMVHNDDEGQKQAPQYKQARMTCEDTLAREQQMAVRDGVKDGKHACESMPDSWADSIGEFTLPAQETVPREELPEVSLCQSTLELGSSYLDDEQAQDVV